jgi:hypothetical protein
MANRDMRKICRKAHARQLEVYFKSGSGKAFAKRLLR